MRRTIALENQILDGVVLGAVNEAESHPMVMSGGSPYENLLWIEIRYIEKCVKMTLWQKAVFECYVRGMSVRETAQLYHKGVATIHQHLKAAIGKAETYEHRGLLSDMVEIFGWPIVQECLSHHLFFVKE